MARSKSGKSRRRTQIRHRHKRRKKGAKVRVANVAQKSSLSA